MAIIEYETKFYATFAKEYLNNLFFMGSQLKVKHNRITIKIKKLRRLTTSTKLKSTRTISNKRPWEEKATKLSLVIYRTSDLRRVKGYQ